MEYGMSCSHGRSWEDSCPMCDRNARVWSGALLILLSLMVWCALAQGAQAADSLTLQTCAVTPSPATAALGLMGCPAASMSFGPVSSTLLVRSIHDNTQGWRAFGSLASTDQVYANDYAWHVLSSITPTLQPPSTGPPAQPPTVACPAAPDVYIAMNWSCAVAAGVATCTAPVKP